MAYGWIRIQPYLLILLMATVRPDSTAVYILNDHLQLVTSTSLRWVRKYSGSFLTSYTYTLSNPFFSRWKVIMASGLYTRF